MQGSAHWMENKHAPTVLSQKAHSRGREDRIFDSLIRNAPREVSEVLHIPMAHVQKLEQKVAKDMVHRFNQEKKAQQMHSVHRGMLKGQGGMMLEYDTPPYFLSFSFFSCYQCNSVCVYIGVFVTLCACDTVQRAATMRRTQRK